MRSVVAILCACIVCAAFQRVAPATPDLRISTAEAAAASFPFAGRTPPERKCARIKPEQIVFPSTKGDPAAFTLFSGEFRAGSLSFGWDEAYEIGKMPLWPRYPETAGPGLRMDLIRIDPPGEQRLYEVKQWNGIGFATWPTFPTPGTWMIVATAGVNWGCFVFDRPVK